AQQARDPIPCVDCQAPEALGQVGEERPDQGAEQSQLLEAPGADRFDNRPGLAPEPLDRVPDMACRRLEPAERAAAQRLGPLPDVGGYSLDAAPCRGGSALDLLPE